MHPTAPGSIYVAPLSQPQTVFKTLPGKGVSCIQLGGAIGSVQDKIFVAAGNEITGYTRKGKQFLKFDTNLTDTIRCIWKVKKAIHVSMLQGAGALSELAGNTAHTEVTW
ncbi:hypothetical protein HPB49_003003 [Dermacentor silvarum]|uniref:Uncharacterized protein n=1 Tax=Dermacentor silvarum TaxID=543639 RepID=A0ACB8CUV4_DERSI|nr:hypothetical protein HPB49_003003 [Dermacentor silvarum]